MIRWIEKQLGIGKYADTPKPPSAAELNQADTDAILASGYMNTVGNSGTVEGPGGNRSERTIDWVETTLPDGRVVKLPKASTRNTFSDTNQKIYDSAGEANLSAYDRVIKDLEGDTRSQIQNELSGYMNELYTPQAEENYRLEEAIKAAQGISDDSISGDRRFRNFQDQENRNRTANSLAAYNSAANIYNQNRITNMNTAAQLGGIRSGMENFNALNAMRPGHRYGQVDASGNMMNSFGGNLQSHVNTPTFWTGAEAIADTGSNIAAAALLG